MISIIIPIYNAEKYIEKCLFSLLEQTYTDIEIIAVDDKGPDQSMQVVKDIQQQHPDGNKIQIVEMEHNSGAAAARNKGLQLAQGDYVAFVDSDDWCEPTMYEELYASAIANDCDWCYSNAVKEYADGRKKLLSQPHYFNGTVTPNMRKKAITNFVAYFTTAIYKKEFLQKYKIQFPLYRFSEDSFFFWNVVMHVQRVGSINKPFYHYIMQPLSVTNTHDKSKHLQKIEIFNKFIESMREDNFYSSYKEELDYLYIKKGFFIPLSIYTIHAKQINKKEYQNYFNQTETLIPDYVFNPYLQKNIKLRILLTIAHYCPSIFHLIMTVYSKFNPENF